jgi:hypothetical protein
MRVSVWEGLRAFYSRFGWNTVSMVYQLFGPYGMTVIWLKIFLLVQISAALVAVSTLGLWLFRKARLAGAGLARPLQAQLLLYPYVLGGILALMILLHYGSVAYHYAPFLLIVFLLLIALSHFKAVGVVLLTNLLAVSMCLSSFGAWRAGAFDFDDENIRVPRQVLSGILVHQPGQDPWCNTLLSMAEPFTYEELAVTPPGIGYSVHLAGPGDASLKLPLKSRYVLLRAGQPPLPAFGRLQRLAGFPFGDVYLNLDSACQVSTRAAGPVTARSTRGAR